MSAERARRRREARGGSEAPRYATVSKTIDNKEDGTFTTMWYAPPDTILTPEMFDKQISERKPVPGGAKGEMYVMVAVQVDPDGSSAMLTFEPFKP